MTDRADGLSRLKKGFDKRDCFGNDPQIVGVGDASRQQQGIIVGGRRARQRDIDRHFVSGRVMIKPLHLPLDRRNNMGGRSRRIESLARLGQLHLLKSIGDQDRHLFSV